MSLSTNLSFGLGLKLALDGFNGLRTQQNALKKLGKAAKLSGEQIKTLNKDLNRLNKLDLKIGLAKERFANFKGELMANVAKMGALAVPVKLAGDYESALADFNNAAKLDESNLKSMNEYFLKLSNKTSIAAKDIALLGQNIAKMGVPKDDLKDYLSTATKLQNALGFSTEETSETLQSLNTHFKLSSKEALSLGDDIFALGNNFNASSKDIARLTARLGANAKMFGLNANEMAVLGASFLDVAKGEGQAEMMLSSLSDKLMNINDLGANSKELLKSLGMDAEQIEIGMKIDPKQTLDLFFNRLKITKKANEKQYNELLSSMFGANASVMNAFVQNLDKYNEATANIGKNKGALDAENKAIKELFNNKVATFTNNLQTLSIQIGNVFLPIVGAVIDKLSGVFSWVSDLITTYPTLSKIIIGAVGGYMALSTALSVARGGMALFSLLSGNLAKNLIFAKNVAMIFGQGLLKMANFTKIATIATRIFNFVLAANPIGLIITTITTLGVLIYTHWDTIKEKTAWLCDFLGKVFKPPIEFIKKIFNYLVEKIKQRIDFWVGVFKKAASLIGEFFKNPIEFIFSKIQLFFVCNIYNYPLQLATK